MNNTNAQPEEPQKPDKDAITPIFEQFAPPLYKFTVRLCGEPKVADQIVGDAFAQLLQESSTGKGLPPDPRLSLYRFAYNSCIAYLREHPQDPVHSPSLEAALNTPLSPERASSRPLSHKPGMKEAFLNTLGDKLTQDLRHVMVLYFLEDFTVRKISKITGKRTREIDELLNEIRKVFDDQLESLAKSLR